VGEIAKLPRALGYAIDTQGRARNRRASIQRAFGLDARGRPGSASFNDLASSEVHFGAVSSMR
jgi:hypothetical protein